MKVKLIICPICDGLGYDPYPVVCNHCKGEGNVEKRKKVTVTTWKRRKG